MNVGQKITMLRQESNIYQRELADYLNLSIGTISNYEKGIHSPDLDTLVRIADYFEVTTDFLLDRTNNRYSADTLEMPLTKSFTVADLIDTSLDLSPEKLSSAIDYIRYLRAMKNNKQP